MKHRYVFYFCFLSFSVIIVFTCYCTATGGGIELFFFSLGRGGLELEWRGTYLPDLFIFFCYWYRYLAEVGKVGTDVIGSRWLSE